MQNATPSQSLHGHIVMRMIIDADPPHTRDSLGLAVDDAFGPEVRFHTCSAEQMDLDQLLAFLAERGKVDWRDGCLVSDPALVCDHE